MRKKILFFVGTRPEAIKLAPTILAAQNESVLDVRVCSTGQHRELLNEVLEAFHVQPHYQLDVMVANQTLDGLTVRLLASIGAILDEWKPSMVVVQGDTTTAMVGALAAFYRKIKIAHVEAGLRSDNIYSPWPEEGNRKIISAIANLHFAPTNRAAHSLLRENIDEESISVTGNTVVDALLTARKIVESKPDSQIVRDLRDFVAGRRLILVTAHRRENFGRGLYDIADALRDIARRGDVAICLPVHPNPNVSEFFQRHLADQNSIKLIPPLSYLDLVRVLLESYIVLTDSGGLQEEAPTFGKPVLVMRDTTERPEGVESGTSLLVGTDRRTIVDCANRLLDHTDDYAAMARAHNPFGDGSASSRIIEAILRD